MNLTDARFLLTLLICPQKKLNADLSPLVTKALPLAPIQNLTGYPSRPQLVDLLRTFAAKICFLEFTDTPLDAFNTLETLRVLAPDLPVIAVVSGNRQEVVLECLRRGASEFLTVPLSPDQLDGCLTRVMRLVRTPTDDAVRGKLVAVLPAKAGAGATTLACSLSAAAKKRGKTLLADLDPLTGTVSFLLRLKSGYSFMDVLQRSSQLDADLWKQMVTAANGFDVLLAPDGAVDPATELPTADPVLGYAQTRYETVVADLAPSATFWNLTVARACDELLMVCTADLLSLHAAQRMLAWLDKCDIDSDKIRLVVNQHAKSTGLAIERVTTALGREPFAVLPADPDSVGKSVMEAKPAGAATPFGREAAKLMEKLLPDTRTVPGAVRKDKPGLLAGLFGRR
jgi:pilus assembly protein CpaE